MPLGSLLRLNIRVSWGLTENRGMDTVVSHRN